MKLKHNDNVDDFEILKFFSYTSTIPSGDTLVDIDYYDTKKYPLICKKIDQLLDDLAKKGADLVKESNGEGCSYFKFRDNKIVWQLRHKFSGRIIFVGRYDSRRVIGTSAYMYDGRIFDFTKMKETEYMSDVVANQRGMFVKFEI